MRDNLNKQDIIRIVSQRAGVAPDITEQVLDGLESALTEELQGAGAGKIARLIELFTSWKTP